MKAGESAFGGLDGNFEVPILWLVFNRPDKTAEVFRAIRAVRPSQLFVVADGPREGQPDDARNCAEVRRLIAQGIDWDCRLETRWRETNLGCRQSVSEGISWFFDQVEEGIVLEDDTLPTRSFFSYCRELLHRYRDEPRVMHIGGDNFHFGRKRGSASYYASKFPYIWGWATWRRAWRTYDVALTSFPSDWKHIRNRWLTEPEERRFWKGIFGQVKAGLVDTWDYQWTYALLANQGISLLPNCNLVTNIGFGGGAASHTQDGDSLLSCVPLEELRRMRHPGGLAVDHAADSFVFQHLVLGRPMPAMNLSQKVAKWGWDWRNRQRKSRPDKQAGHRP